MNTLTDAVKGIHCAYALRLEGYAHDVAEVVSENRDVIEQGLSTKAGI